MPVAFRAVIEMTPIAGMPIDINGAVTLTDNDGELAIVLQENGNYSIVSGMPGDTGNKAIDFAEIVDSGRSLADRSVDAPIDIEMTRNIAIERPVCRSTVSGVEFVQFFFNNRVSTPLQVPLSYSRLNQILSPAGDQTPIELFPSGSHFFYLPLSGFQSAGTYVGQWNFVGQSEYFNSLPPPCTDGGDPDCTPINEQLLDNIWEFFNREVKRQVSQANSLAGKTWRPKPSERLFVFNRGARSLAPLRKELGKYEGTLECSEATSAACRTLKFDKAAIRTLFMKLFVGNPRGLEPLAANQKAKQAALEQLLKPLPKNVTKCD